MRYRTDNPKYIAIKSYMSENDITDNVYENFKKANDLNVSRKAFAQHMNSLLPDDRKYCSTCDRILDIGEFSLSKQHPDGYQCTCKECRADYHRKHRSTLEETKRKWCRGTLHCHRKSEFKVNINIDDLHRHVSNISSCKLCGATLEWTGGFGPNSPTLDRKYNENEINLSNIQILCHACNARKLNGSIEDDLERCRRVVKIAEERGHVFTL